MLSFEGNLITQRRQRHEICSQETINPTLSYGDNPESLYHLGLIRYYGVVTPGQTDRQTDSQIYDS